MRDRLFDKLTEKSFDMWEFRVFNAEYREVGSDWCNMVENFPYYRLYYVFDCNEAYITLKSEIIKLQPGHLYFIPAFQIVSGRCLNLKHNFIHFAPVSDLIHIFEGYSQVIDIECDTNINMFFETVFENYTNGEVSSRLASSGALQMILSKIIKENKDEQEGNNSLLLVLKYIDKNIDKQINLDDLAKIMNYNKTYLGNKFKRVYGMSPGQYIIDKKVKVACRLLSMTDVSVKDIAYSLGFQNEFYFSRIFKQKIKVSPKDYKSIQKSLND